MTDDRNIPPCECGEVLENLPPGVSHCWVHHVNEPWAGAHIVCFECAHVYRTAQDLLDAFNREMPEECPPATSTDDIGFCPECLHDF